MNFFSWPFGGVLSGTPLMTRGAPTVLGFGWSRCKALIFFKTIPLMRLSWAKKNAFKLDFFFERPFLVGCPLMRHRGGGGTGVNAGAEAPPPRGCEMKTHHKMVSNHGWTNTCCFLFFVFCIFEGCFSRDPLVPPPRGRGRPTNPPVVLAVVTRFSRDKVHSGPQRCQ